jgi:hypothetical protein
MTRDTRRSGLTLLFVGLAGIAFFWITDPRWGWTELWSEAGNLVDRANEAVIGTIVGLIGCAGMVITGLWLIVRRTG